MSDQPANEPPPPADRAPLDSPPPPKKGAKTLLIVLLLVAVGVVLVLICGGILLAIALPALLKSKTVAQQYNAIVELKNVSSAQAMYQLDRGYFADSAAALGEDGYINDPTVVAAFEQFLDNADSGTQPKNGYLYRMLQGEGTDPDSWRAESTDKGHFQLSSWAATARPALPGEDDGPQFWIGEAGYVYRSDDQTNQNRHGFILDAAPSTSSTDPQWQLAR